MGAKLLRVMVAFLSLVWAAGVLLAFPSLAAWLWMHENVPLWGRVVGTLLAAVLLVVVACPLAWLAAVPLAWAWSPGEFRRGFAAPGRDE